MISNINIKGINYSIGGDNKAKLVARGTYSAEDISVPLNNKLKMNKVYLVEVVELNYGLTFSALLHTSIDTPSNIILLADEMDENTIICEMYYIDSAKPEICIYSITGGNTILDVSTENYINVYELPFTLGGNE